MNKSYLYGSVYRVAYSLPKSSVLPQKWPEDIQCVYPSKNPNKGSIYVSNVEAASNYLTLSRLNIKAVMTCARGHDRNIPKSKLEMFQYFPFDDKETCDLSPYFEHGCNFIANAKDKTNVLVHCIAGVSRSVSMVLAYLIRDKDMTYDEAYSCVKLHRKIISPNEGFIKQLKEYETKIKKRKLKDQPGQKTAVKESNYFTEKVANRSMVLERKTIQEEKEPKQKNIQNEEESEGVEGKGYLLKLSTPNPKAHKISMTPSNYRRSFNDFGNSQINSTQIAKSSIIIHDTRTTATPEKQKEKEKSKQKEKVYTKPAEVVDSGKKNYFKQMSKELNQKIDAIHAKYEKQREELMARRGNVRIASEAHKHSEAHKLTDRSNQMKSGKEGEKVEKARNVGGYLNTTKYSSSFYESRYSKGLRYSELRPTELSYYNDRYY